MTVIIAEKPSLARNIAAGIGQTSRKNGYLEGNGYIITWAFGHLFSLADVEEYTGEDAGKRWSMQGLPCLSAETKLSVIFFSDSRRYSGRSTELCSSTVVIT